MTRFPLLSLCLVVLAAVAASPAAAAADKTRGMALLSANVSGSGTLIGGVGAVSSSRTSVGLFVVTFARNVEDCTPVANIGSSLQGGSLLPGMVSANVHNIFDAPNPEDISVFTSAANGNAADIAFHLIVFCGE